MLRAALYGRFSSDNQREESIMAQFRDSEEYCKKKNYCIVARYADEAKSGTTTVGRDRYNQMLDDARRGLFDVIVFHKVDRNARNEFDYYMTKHKLQQIGVRYEYSKQDLDATTPEGQMMESMLVGMAAYYSRNLSNEIKKGLRENVLQGKHAGGPVPYGFLTDENKKYVINEKEAPAVRMIFNLYVAGVHYGTIRKKLFDAGYRNRAGREFTTAGIYEILRNRKYVGDLYLGKTLFRKGRRNSHRTSDDVQYYENVIPAIIPRSLFMEVQEKMDRNRRRTGSGNAKTVYALSGLIFCGRCGSAMVAHSTKNSRGVKNYYYRCPKGRLVGEEKCHQKFVNRDKIETAVYNLIRDTFTSPDAHARIKEVISKNKIKMNPEDYTDQIKRLKQQEAADVRSLDRLYDIYMAEQEDEFTVSKMKKLKEGILRLRNQIQELETRQKIVQSEKFDIDRVIETFQKQLKQKQSPEFIQTLFQLAVKSVTIYPDKIKVALLVTQERFELPTP